MSALRDELSGEARNAFDILAAYDSDTGRVEELRGIMQSAGILAVAAATELENNAVEEEVLPLVQEVQEPQQPVGSNDEQFEFELEQEDDFGPLSIAGIVRSIREIPDDGLKSLSPAQLWQTIGGSPDGSMSPNDRVRLRTATDREGRLRHNGKRGRGSLYEPIGITTSEDVQPQEGILSMKEAAIAASSIGLLNEALSKCGVTKIDHSVVDDLTEMVDTSPSSSTTSSIQEDRIRALQKIITVLNDGEMFSSLVNSVSPDDPRYQLIEYFVQESGHLQIIGRLLEGNRKRLTVTQQIQRTGSTILGSAFEIDLSGINVAEPTIPTTGIAETSAIEPNVTPPEETARIVAKPKRANVAATLELLLVGEASLEVATSKFPWISETKEIKTVSLLTSNNKVFSLGNLIGASEKIREVAVKDTQGKPEIDDQLNRDLISTIDKVMQGKQVPKLKNVPGGAIIYYSKDKNGERVFFAEGGLDSSETRTFVKVAICTNKQSESKVLKVIMGKNYFPPN